MQVVVRTGDDAHEQVAIAGNGVDFCDLGDLGQCLDRVVVRTLRNLQRAERQYIKAQGATVEFGAPTHDDPVGFQPLDTGVDGAASQVGAACDLGDTRSRIGPQGPQEPNVGCVKVFGRS